MIKSYSDFSEGTEKYLACAKTILWVNRLPIILKLRQSSKGKLQLGICNKSRNIDFTYLYLSWDIGTINLSRTIMASRPLDIQSTDIDVSRIPLDAIYTMRSIFPHEEDETIARFLLARNGNIEKAKTLLEEDIAWRATNWPVLKSSCISEINKGKLYLHGVDLEGHPLLVWRVRFNLPSERDIDEMGRMSMWWLYSAIRAMPRDKSKITLLMDRSGFKSENSDFEFVKHLTPIFQVVCIFYTLQQAQFCFRIISLSDFTGSLFIQVYFSFVRVNCNVWMFRWARFLWYLECREVVSGSGHSSQGSTCSCSLRSSAVY